MKTLPILPTAVQAVMATLAQAGGEAYLVESTLLNLLNGDIPARWQLVTTVPTATVQALFDDAVPQPNGELKVIRGQLPIYIRRCRTEADAGANHPFAGSDGVPTIFWELGCQDFTVFAMAYNGRLLLDPFGGANDRNSRLLRCVGSAEARFDEAPARLLKLLRCAATMGYAGDAATVAMAGARIKQVNQLELQTVRREVDAILQSDVPDTLRFLINQGGMASYFLYNASPLDAISDVPKEGIYRWWALLVLCATIPGPTARKLRFDANDIFTIQELSRLYCLGPATSRLHLKQQIKNTTIDYAPAAAAFEAIDKAFAGELLLFAAVHVNDEPYRLKDLAITDDMPRHEGIRGRAALRILDQLLDLVIKTPTLNRTDQLLKIANKLARLN